MTVIRVTQEMIEAARSAFKRNLEERDNSQEVVVARGVTREDFDAIPADWMEGIVLALLPDGTLVVDRLTFEGNNIRQVTNTLERFFLYAIRCKAPIAVDADPWMPVEYKELGVFTHDAVVYEVEDEATRTPLAVCDIVVDGTSLDRTLRNATGYLRHSDSVQRVIVFHATPPVLRKDRHWDHWEIQVLALALGLEDASDRASRIRILDAKSFGNVGVDETVVDALVAGTSAGHGAACHGDRSAASAVGGSHPYLQRDEQ